MTKKLKWILFFFVLICAKGFAQEDTLIAKIRLDFQKWQPIIEKELNQAQKLYHIMWGEDFMSSGWLTSEHLNDSLHLAETVTILEQKNEGFFVTTESYSLSGDWFVTFDQYYDKDGLIYFIFWRMNTFLAEEPLTIEKRLYFDPQGYIIRELNATYKMNTKEEVLFSYYDQEIDYQPLLFRTNYFNIWKNEINKPK